MKSKNFVKKIYNIILRILGIFQREIACMLLKKSFQINKFTPKYITRIFPFIKADKTLLKHIESAICLSDFSISKFSIVSPINFLCASNPSCFNVNNCIYVIYTIHNHKTTASRRFSYTDNLRTSRIGFGLSIITDEGEQRDLGTANLNDKQNNIIICDFRCLTLKSSVLISCNIENGETSRIGWCLVPFKKLEQGPSQWIFCIESSPFDYETEKNWSPIHTGEDTFKFIYRPEGKNLSEKNLSNEYDQNSLIVYSNSENFSYKSGGSPFLKLEKFFVGAVHQTYAIPYRNYLHFFSIGEWVSQNNFKTLISKKPFFFFEPFDSEYCCGICEIGDYIIFSFGFRNSEAWLMKLNRKTFFKIINLSF